MSPDAGIEPKTVATLTARSLARRKSVILVFFGGGGGVGGGGDGEFGMRPKSLPEVSTGRIPVHDRDPEIRGIVHVDRPPVRRYCDPVAPVK